jgi:hypothetical protein
MKKLIPVILSFFVSATVMWNPSPETDLAGYRLYMNTTENGHVRGVNSSDLVLDVGAGFTQVIVPSIPDGGMWYGLTAYDLSGNESGFGTKVFHDPAPGTVQITVILSK